VDYINNLPQILSKTAQQQQAQPSLQHPSKGLDSSKLEHHLVQPVTQTIKMGRKRWFPSHTPVISKGEA